MSLSITTYILDGKGRIISINGPWDEFAHENGGVDIYANDIQGQLIWDFISGDATRMWFDTLINFAAVKNEIIKRPYRCDSPDFKRYMRMTITPEGNGLLRIDHELLSLEQRKNPIYPVHESKSISNISRIRCSICGRINNGISWEEPHIKHTTGLNEIVVIYTVCNECKSSLPVRQTQID
jgi:hypothetical protein